MQEEIQIRYALISDNVVMNLIICDNPQKLVEYRDKCDHIECIDTEQERKFCGVGAHWDSANGTFFYPPPPPVYDIPSVEFKNRFTREEKIALYETAKTDIATQVFLDDLNSNPSINVQDQETIDSVDHLVFVGVIVQARVEEILKPN